MDGNGHNPTENAPRAIVRMVIELDQMSGAVKVDGPINNGVLAYGLLELAKQAIQNHIQSLSKEQRIIPGNLLPLIKH